MKPVILGVECFSQASGRPEWERHLTSMQKLEADRLRNNAMVDRSPENIEAWNSFYLTHSRPHTA